MLRQICDHKPYWFCRHCWEVMPVSDLKSWGSLPRLELIKTANPKKQLSASGVS